MGNPRPDHKPAWPWTRRRAAQEELDRAHVKAAEAALARAEQEAKLAGEKPLHHQIDMLSEENHLAALVWVIIGGDTG
jgi:hypothetical protein